MFFQRSLLLRRPFVQYVLSTNEVRMPPRDIFSMLSRGKASVAATAGTAADRTTRTTKEDISDSDKENKRMRDEPVELAIDKKPKLDLAERTQKKGAIIAETTPESVTAPASTGNPPILYSAVAQTFEAIEATSKRLEITAITSEFFLRVLQQDPAELTTITYLFINKLCPDYEGLELGLGETILIKTIVESTGKSTAQIKAKYKETGDLGVIAQQARAVQPTMFKPKVMTAVQVFEDLRKIAQTSGKDSQGRKISIIKRMLTAMSGVEAKFLIRTLESKLRIGLAEKTVLSALARALLTYEKGKKPSDENVAEVEEIIRDAFCQVPNYDVLISAALEYGVTNLRDHCVLTPGIPLKPMLAKPTKAITEVLDKFDGRDFICEYKYDGERAQVHLLSDGTIKVFSRNSEDMSERYPDIIDSVRGFLKDCTTTNSLILDCEAVAWDSEKAKILPFQVLTTRKRKDVQLGDIKIRVCLFAFDILCHNDKPLINLPLRERRAKLEKLLIPTEGKFQFSTAKITHSTDEIQDFLDASIRDQCEGLMVKTLDNDPYRPSQRTNTWLKLKKDYLEGIGDSLDLVVVGAYFGKGKRTGTYGGFLLASYNADTDEFETCCKIGTGFSDADLASLYAKLSPTELEDAPGDCVYDPSAEPDVWVEPKLMFEVLTADLSLSPIYKSGAAILGKGVSLRFPRFVRLREDKDVKDGTESTEVVEFYERQAHLG